MKFLLDQDVYVITVRFLAALGHDVIRAAEVGLSTSSDEDILREAQSSGRLLVTRDRDFGNLVFVRGLGPGVLYLRILPSTQNAVHSELERILSTYSEEGWCPSLRRTYRTASGSERVDGGSQRNTRSLLLAVLYQNFKLGQYRKRS